MRLYFRISIISSWDSRRATPVSNFDPHGTPAESTGYSPSSPFPCSILDDMLLYINIIERDLAQLLPFSIVWFSL